MFLLTINRSHYEGKENIICLHSKMVIIRELQYINLNDLSISLSGIKVKNLNILCIDDDVKVNNVNVITSNVASKVSYTEMNSEYVIKHLNHENEDFFDYNQDTLYVLRDGNFLDIKNLFSTINHNLVNIGRGASQKAHVLSPLDIRLTGYLMAMFNFNYELISKLNAYNYIPKSRYLSYKDKICK
jgi:hypothetical protein